MEKKRNDLKRLIKSFYNIEAQYVAAAKKIGCKTNIFWFLYSLDNNEPLSQKQIAQDWGMPKTTLNTLVKECENAGYIKFEAIKGERREKVIKLTQNGKKYAKHILNKIYKAEERALLNMDDYKNFIIMTEDFSHKLKESLENLI